MGAKGICGRFAHESEGGTRRLERSARLCKLALSYISGTPLPLGALAAGVVLLRDALCPLYAVSRGQKPFPSLFSVCHCPRMLRLLATRRRIPLSWTLAPSYRAAQHRSRNGLSFYAGLAMAANAADSGVWTRVTTGPTPYDVFTKPIQKSPQDDREYRLIRLENGIQAMLVHHAKADKAAASLDVAVGHLYDPVSS